MQYSVPIFHLPHSVSPTSHMRKACVPTSVTGPIHHGPSSAWARLPSPTYFFSSARAAFAGSTAGPSVTFSKAAMACGFISLALYAAPSAR